MQRTPIPMPEPPLGPLPIIVPRFDDESGMSYVMRSFWSNGLSFDRGFKWLHIRPGRPLHNRDLQLIAWTMQAPPAWLLSRLLHSTGSVGNAWVALGSHEFRPGTTLCGRVARLCPQCIRERDYCGLSWVLKHVPCCEKHGLPLLERCLHCGDEISWNRPAIDLCRCGRYFQPVDGGVTMAHSVLEWCRWVSARLMSLEQYPHQLPLQEDIPRVLNEVSLDAAFRLVEAFGLLHRARSEEHTSELQSH